MPAGIGESAEPAPEDYGSSGSSAVIAVPRPGVASIRTRPLNRLDALADAGQAEPPGSRIARIEAVPVVLDRRHHRVGPRDDGDVDAGGMGVAECVRDRLLHDPVDGRLDLGGQALLVARGSS